MSVYACDDKADSLLRGQGLGPQSRKEKVHHVFVMVKEAFTLVRFFLVEHQTIFDIIEITDLEALKHFLDAVTSSSACS